VQETRVHGKIGPEVPGYRVLRVLGAGGMASVYLAVQESLEREVALKVMSPQLAADPEFTQRFLKEGRITARLAHPNLVTVYDIGSHEGVYYLAAEYIGGGTLRDRMNDGLRVPEILDIVIAVARGLHFAHDRGVVHRDIKPTNILFKTDGTVVLADFGIAKALDSSSTATMAGASVGTPDYMSPEQARGEPVDGRADLYALGVMLYELLIGRPPYDGSDPFAVALAHLTQPVPTLPSEFAWLQPVLDRLMAKQPKDRFDSGEHFVAALTRLRERMPKAQAEAVLRHDTAKRTAIESAATVPVSTGATRPAPAIGVRRRWPLALGAAALLAAVLGALLWERRETIVPVDADPAAAVDAVSAGQDLSEVDTLLMQAEAYLDYGFKRDNLGRRLIHPEDDSALALFQRALALEPGNSRARSGLKKLTEFYVDSARSFCERGLWHACATVARDGLKVEPENAVLAELVQRAEASLAGE
jgi:serine/threonine-protein kinase PpkA